MPGVPEEQNRGPAEENNEAATDAPEAADEHGAADAPDADGKAKGADGDDLGPLPPGVMPALDLSGMINLPDFSKLVRNNLPDFSKLVPDLSAIMPSFDFGERIIPALRLSAFAPKIDYATLFPEIRLAVPVLDFSAVLPKLRLPDFAPAFSRFLEQLRERLPPNWPAGVDLDELVTVIQDDGLPLVWVPRAEIVTKLLAAPDRAARVEALLAHVEEIVADCREVLADVTHDTLSGQLPLAAKALDAFEAGHHEAAQALAVTVTETAVARTLGSKYGDVKRQVLFDPDLVPYTEMRLRAALAPIGPFYTPWYAASGMPAPEALSRHVTVHQADQSHYRHGNGAVAVFL
jgi:hypothetical protein